MTSESELGAPCPPDGVVRRTALVTGSSSGIGIAIARQLGFMGFNIGLTCMPNESHDALDLLMSQLQDVYGVQCAVFEVDLQNPEVSAPRLMAQHIEKFGRLDVLVNNAGWAAHAGKNFMDLAASSHDLIQKFRSGFAVNFEAAVLLSYEAVRQFRRQAPPDSAEPRILDANTPDLNEGFYTSRWGAGRIINTSSVHGLTPLPKSSIYTMAKHALNGLTVFLASELGPEGINVNGVAPGLIATPQTMINPNDVELTEHRKPELFVPRPGLPSEIGAAVGFFASLGGRYTTGQTLKVDGGFCDTNPQFWWNTVSKHNTGEVS